MKKLLTIGCLAVTVGIVACTNLERSRTLGNPDISATVMAQQVCSNCHGVEGTSISPNFPNLAGQTEEYFVLQMTGFRGHSRADPAGFEYMWGLSRGLSDDQIKGLATYFGKQTPVKNPAASSVKLEVISAGEAIYKNGVAESNVPACATCHGDVGQGNAQFPRLASQHADYLTKQLMVFQRTDERPEGSIMKTIAHGLTEQNMKDVAAYLQTL
jgi:cytochrome c553